MSRHIFLIDDDPVINLINKKIINKTFPSKVTAFTHASDALLQLKNWAGHDPGQLPHFIFLDINMPGIDGWEFLDEFIKFPQTVQKIQVIMLTSSIDNDDIDRSRKYKPVLDFISKPLTVDILNRLLGEGGKAAGTPTTPAAD